MAGGIILFIIALQMIFPAREDKVALKAGEEPFIVPLAVPLIAGPAILGTVMIYASRTGDFLTMSIALIIAWIVSLVILLSSTWLQRLFGNRVLTAGERLMGFIMTLIAVNLLTDGIIEFLRT
jgi:multiple antibiotic resistance protein